MEALRQQWLDMVVKWRLHPDEPADEQFWAPELETCSRERLQEIQNEKLAVLIPYLLEYSPFYRNKLAQAKLTAQDIQCVDDLSKVPPTTKAEMVQDVAAQDEENLKAELVRQLRAVIEVRPRVEVVPPSTMSRPEFKASRVRDERREF